MSMNCKPPLEIAARKPAALPVENARILKSRKLNIGDATRRSIVKKATRNTTPMMKAARTLGDVHPIALVP